MAGDTFRDVGCAGCCRAIAGDCLMSLGHISGIEPGVGPEPSFWSCSSAFLSFLERLAEDRQGVEPCYTLELWNLRYKAERSLSIADAAIEMVEGDHLRLATLATSIALRTLWVWHPQQPGTGLPCDGFKCARLRVAAAIECVVRQHRISTNRYVPGSMGQLL